MDEHGHADVSEFELGKVLGALQDPMRRHVVWTLACMPLDAEQPCSYFNLPVSPSSRTYHFKILREAGLVWQVDLGNRKMTRLRRREIDARFPGLLDAIVGNHPQGNAELPQ